MGLVLETAIDITSLNQRNLENNQPKREVKFAASFPFVHDVAWFNELRSIKAQSGESDLEIKWKWFSNARSQISKTLIEKVYQGLGESTISIQDLSTYTSIVRQSLSEVGLVGDRYIVRDLFLDFLLQDSPLSEIGNIYELVTEESNPFTPKNIKKALTAKTGSFANTFEFVSTLTPSFQELRDETHDQTLAQYALAKRFINSSEIEIQRMMLALGPKRVIDDGHRTSANLVCQVRIEIANKLSDGLALMGITPLVDSFGSTEILGKSLALDTMQMADLAAGYAEELYSLNNHEAPTLLNHFKCVLLNSRLVRR